MKCACGAPAYWIVSNKYGADTVCLEHRGGAEREMERVYGWAVTHPIIH